VGSNLIGGGVDPGSFAGSMAEAIEQAFSDLLVSQGKDPLPTADTQETRDRRTLFVAIARGVISHLQANDDAFSVVFTNTPPGTEDIAAEIDIQ
jgi:hypothetical protein